MTNTQERENTSIETNDIAKNIGISLVEHEFTFNDFEPSDFTDVAVEAEMQSFKTEKSSLFNTYEEIYNKRIKSCLDPLGADVPKENIPQDYKAEAVAECMDIDVQRLTLSLFTSTNIEYSVRQYGTAGYKIVLPKPDNALRYRFENLHPISASKAKANSWLREQVKILLSKNSNFFKSILVSSDCEGEVPAHHIRSILVKHFSMPRERKN